MSETLLRVTQLKIRDIFLFVCIYVWTYVICTLTLVYFCVSLVVDPIPNFTEQNPLVYRSLPVSSNGIELFTALNYLLWVQLALRSLPEFIFYSMSGGVKLMRYLSHLCASHSSVVFLT